MNETFVHNSSGGRERLSVLYSFRLPGRLNSEQAAELIGCKDHDIPALIRAGLLKPLGGGPRNSVKYFASNDVEDKRQNPKWLDRVTRTLARRGASPKSENNSLAAGRA